MKKLVKKNENRLMNINIQAFGDCGECHCTYNCNKKIRTFKNDNDGADLPSIYK